MTDTPPTDSGPDTSVLPSPPEPLDTTCWLRLESCDWTAAGFTLVEFTGTGRFTDPNARTPTFSPDGCSVYFTDLSSGDLYRTDRPAPGAPFSAPVELSELNTIDSDDEAASLGPDKLELFFTSTRGESGLRRIHRADRAAPTGPWANPTIVAALDLPETRAYEPRIAPHGLRLYFAPEDIAETVQSIMVAERDTFADSFGPPTAIDLAGIGALDTNRPSVTHTGRVLVGIMQSGNDISSRQGFYSLRDHWQAEWQAVQTLPSVLSSEGFRDIAVSPDGCEVIIRTLDAEPRTAVLRYRDPI